MSEPANFADHQQRRGAALDIIDEAIQTYDEYMLDDDYEREGIVLDLIINRMRERRAGICQGETQQ